MRKASSRPKKAAPKKTEAERLKHVADMREIFDLFDRDHSGSIDVGEVKLTMKALGFDQTTKQEVVAMINAIDKNHDSVIDFDEFCEMMDAKLSSRDPRADMISAFETMDIEKGGSLTVEDIKRAAGLLGEVITDDDARGMIEMATNDEEATVVTREQFMDVVTRATAQQ
jgi:Ca2+-binding EF-hand superfamily protein